MLLFFITTTSELSFIKTDLQALNNGLASLFFVYIAIFSILCTYPLVIDIHTSQQWLT